MRFKLEIECDNGAFRYRPASEIARLLRDVATRVSRDGEGALDVGKVRDTNGNTVGKFWTED